MLLVLRVVCSFEHQPQLCWRKAGVLMASAVLLGHIYSIPAHMLSVMSILLHRLCRDRGAFEGMVTETRKAVIMSEEVRVLNREWLQPTAASSSTSTYGAT